MRAILRGALLGAGLCLVLLLFGPWAGRSSTGDVLDAQALAARPIPSFQSAARRGVAELTGGAGPGFLARSDLTGLWGGHSKPNWWQSALMVQALVRYAERTGADSALIQHVLLTTYQQTVAGDDGHHTIWRRHFADQFMDDTAWWAIAWLYASRYELYDQHDLALARAFLSITEWDAHYIAHQPRGCGGGVEWMIGAPPDTATNAEYTALAAGLGAYLRAPGPLQDERQSTYWIAQALRDLAWMVHVRLLNIRPGMVMDRLRPGCHGPTGGAITYTQGEVAEALVQLGNATHRPRFYRQAERFLRYAISPRSHLTTHGILIEHCELRSGGCLSMPNPLDIPAYKGIFVDAVSDWSAATGSTEFLGFLGQQAHSLLEANAVPGRCQADTGGGCRFAFDWRSAGSGGLADAITIGSQESALDALTAAIR
jgi:hypothetical protein